MSKPLWLEKRFFFGALHAISLIGGQLSFFDPSRISMEYDDDYDRYQQEEDELYKDPGEDRYRMFPLMSSPTHRSIGDTVAFYAPSRLTRNNCILTLYP